jgi:hypothetical protein
MTIRIEFSHVVRDQALLRSRYRCEACGSNANLEFHHRGWRADASLFNCQVLCGPCHSQEHYRRKEGKT